MKKFTFLVKFDDHKLWSLKQEMFNKYHLL